MNPRPGEPSPESRVPVTFSSRTGSAGDLIAAIPAALNFVPHRSLVLLALTGTPEPGVEQVVHAVRVDIDDLPVLASGRKQIPGWDSTLQRIGASALVAVVIDDGPRADRHAALAVQWIRAGTIALRGAWQLPSITAGARYRDLLSPDRAGLLPDPAVSPLAVSNDAGSSFFGSRSELAALLTRDRALSAQVEDRIGDTERIPHITELDADRLDNASASALRLVELIVGVDETGYSAEDLAEACQALRRVDIGDGAVALTGPGHSAAAGLWLALTRATTGLDRSRAATLAGIAAYYQRDTVLARMCFTAALESEPGNQLALDLATAVSQALPPREIVTFLARHRGHR